ncbi:MAG: hypothetical protein V1834_04885, partial [Candidatus Micrarchaeota archaeon]
MEEGGGRWESFLEWCREKNIPIAFLADWLEEKGIPSLPVFALLGLLILGGLYYFLIMGITPATGSVTVSVFSPGGEQGIQGVTVTLTDSKNKRYDKTTGANGKVVFDNIPAGQATVVLLSSEFAFDKSSYPVVVAGGTKKDVAAFAQYTDLDYLFLSVSVKGPASAQVSLLDSNGVVVEKRTVSSTNIAQFQVTPQSVYSLHAEAEGYSPDDKPVNVASSSPGLISLKLLEIGESKKGELHVLVTEDAAPQGRPFENATVSILNANTSEVLYSVQTGADGRINPVELVLGTAIRVSASADGFLDSTVTEFTVQDELSALRFSLKSVTVESSDVIFNVLNEKNGEFVDGALVRLYDGGAVKSEAYSQKGRAEFNVSSSSGLSASFYKTGFLPRFLESVDDGVQTVLLEPIDETNSGTVKVLVFDKQDVPVQGASVELKDELTERALGIPARKTGFDGTQVFDGVPIASVFAVASEGGRSAQSGSEYVVPSKSNDTIEFTSLVVTFPLLKGLLKATVRDAFSKDLVSNAVVLIQTANENVSCTTSQGICTANVEETEGAKVFVTASG